MCSISIMRLLLGWNDLDPAHKKIIKLKLQNFIFCHPSGINFGRA